jgi:hypothetical protein
VRHRWHLDPAEVVFRHGIPCTIVERAVFDAVRGCPDLREAVVMVDIALAAGLTTIAQLTAYAAARDGVPGRQLVAHAIDLANDRSRSPNETRMRLIWRIDGRLPNPKCNWPVADLDGRRIGRPDLLSEDLAVVGEFDGADHSGARVRSIDAGKESDYRDAGLEVFRVTGADLVDPARALARMRAAVRRAADMQRARRWMIRSEPGPL